MVPPAGSDIQSVDYRVAEYAAAPPIAHVTAATAMIPSSCDLRAIGGEV
jgi:hypothetical protein